MATPSPKRMYLQLLINVITVSFRNSIKAFVRILMMFVDNRQTFSKAEFHFFCYFIRNLFQKSPILKNNLECFYKKMLDFPFEIRCCDSGIHLLALV